MQSQADHDQPTTPRTRLDMSALRSKLAVSGGKQYWRSLEELAESEEFERFLHAEFPEPAALLDGPVSRRGFIKLMGASLALAGMNACTRQPTEKIFPYVKAPEIVVPGTPLFFATAIPLAGVASGVLVESHIGRPTKIEGNPEHPSSLGATDVVTQASVLGLYDPDRSQVLVRAGEIRPYESFVEEVGHRVEGVRPNQGAGLRILTGAVTSPTLAAQISLLLADYPAARWHRYEAVTRDEARDGARLAFGEYVDSRYHLEKADVIAAFGADFLARGSGGVRYARDFADARRLDDGRRQMNRLYAVETGLSTAGAKADHRLAVRPSEMLATVRELASSLGIATGKSKALEGHEKAWISALARDLQAHRGRCVVLAGDEQPAAVHALIHAINEQLGNAGNTVTYSRPIEADAILHRDSLESLVRDMREGRVEALFILGGNPVYDAPADLDFTGALARVPFACHLGLYEDETAQQCLWHVPEAHPLESWGDARAYDGTTTILQPLIEPLYAGKTAVELIAALRGDSHAEGHELVRAYWRNQWDDGDFEARWRRALHDGLVADSGFPSLRRSVQSGLASRLPYEGADRPSDDDGTVELVFLPDAYVFDGRFANLAWLHELPRPITKLTWDNAVLVGPATAERNGLATGDVVKVVAGERSVDAPVWVAAGVAEGVAAVHLGYGRRAAGHVGNGVGFDAYALRTTDALWTTAGVRLIRTGRRHELATTQEHHSMEGRDLVRHATLNEYERDPHFAQEGHDGVNPHASLFPDHPYDGYAWGMSIDLNACVGCNACTIACQAENNIPVVGKEQVMRGREMHWIRVDRYYEGELDDPRVLHQPVPCMQCEKAPCEVVCPVNATVHSDEGLNDMVYNRCVGTRYCSNNCPYKVRRFNFFLFTDWKTESLKMLNNPDVTVRSRGVMEKCTYCVQRISHARINAKREGRKIQDGEIETACQQVCPAEAITFGDINDGASRVSRRKKDERNYALLAELGTRPRTTYLASVRNSNPEIEKLEGKG